MFNKHFLECSSVYYEMLHCVSANFSEVTSGYIYGADIYWGLIFLDDSIFYVQVNFS